MIFRRIFSYFVNAGGILAASASGMALTTEILLNIPISLPLILAIFLFTLFSYHIDHKTGAKDDIITNPERAKSLMGNNSLDYVITFGFFLSIVLAAYFGNLYSVILILIFPIAVFLYSVEWIPKRLSKFIGFSKVKQILFLKNIFVAIFWSLIAVLTAIFHNYPINNTVVAISGLIFLRFLINTIAFDVKDIFTDRLHQINTLPVMIGVKGTQYLLHTLNLIAFGYLLFFVFLGVFPKAALLLNLIAVYAFYFITKLSNTKINQTFLYDIVIDGEFIVWVPLALLGLYIL
jgi:4-hydroxybenzoate polyprenyltransferase